MDLTCFGQTYFAWWPRFVCRNQECLGASLLEMFKEEPRAAEHRVRISLLTAKSRKIAKTCKIPENSKSRVKGCEHPKANNKIH